MKVRKLLIIFFIIALLILQIRNINLSNLSYATNVNIERTENNSYFYNQLNQEEKAIYDGMLDMYQKGIFKTGNGDYNLTENGHVTDLQIQQTLSGDNKLLNTYGAARDAFCMDFPDVFYVDFSYLTIRIEKDATGKYAAYLGAGRSDTYYMPGFKSEQDVNNAINQYEQKITALVNETKNIKVSEGQDLVKEQIQHVHDYIVRNMIYRFEDEVSQGNARTAYDCLVYGEGVCEAYTKGFKAVLDRLGIPCICVYGVYRASDTADEEHIWNYVKVNGTWYGVDVTHDDPIVKNTTNKNSGKETRENLLVGQLELAARHFPSGIISASNKEFTYPQLSIEALSGQITYQSKDLVVKLLEDTYTDEDGVMESGTMTVSYQGKNYTQNAARGKYILARFATYYPATDEWAYSDWGYITPQLYDVNDIEPTTPDKDGNYYVKLPMPHIKKAQFAVTDIAPDLSQEGILNGGLYYKGNPALLEEKTEEIENVWGGNYVAPPYPKKVSPYMAGELNAGQTYNVTVTYDEKLIPVEGQALSVALVTSSANTSVDNNTAEKHTKIENVKFDGDRTVTFKFTPSAMYADDGTYYNIHIKGLVGEKSRKEPVNITYGAGYRCAVCAYRTQGYDWNVFGQPQLLENSNVSTKGWVTRDMETGEESSNVNISDKITHRLTLVTTKPSPVKQQEMGDILKNSQYGNEEVLASEMYNIKLTLCKKQIIKTGQGVRVSVGFPKGYGPDDAGVTFKAYHYKVDPKTNQITGVEEIDCVVTQYGLILTVDSFSPFTIAAVKADPNDTTQNNKTVIISSTENGQIKDESGNKLEAANGIITLNENQTKNITITANENYEIDEIKLAGKNIEIPEANKTNMALTLSYSELEAKSSILEVKFVSKSIKNNQTGGTNAGQSENTNSITQTNTNTTTTDTNGNNSNTADVNSVNTNTQTTANNITTNNSTTNAQNQSNLPQTGDIAIEILVAIMIVSVIGIMFILSKKNKKGRRYKRR